MIVAEKSDEPPVYVQHVTARPPGEDEPQRWGTVAARYEDGIWYIGWSICHPRDRFSRKIGRAKAAGRTRAKGTGPVMPWWFIENIRQMCDFLVKRGLLRVRDIISVAYLTEDQSRHIRIEMVTDCSV